MPKNVDISGTGLPERLRQLRESKHLTRQELADLAQVTYRTILDLESGRRERVQEKTLMLLAGALGISFHELLNGNGRVAEPSAAPAPGVPGPLTPSQPVPTAAAAATPAPATETAGPVRPEGAVPGGGRVSHRGVSHRGVSLTIAAGFLIAALIGAAWLWRAGVHGAYWELSSDRRTITVYHGILRTVLWAKEHDSEIWPVERVPWSREWITYGLSAQGRDGGRFVMRNLANGELVWQDLPDYDGVVEAFGPEMARTGFHCREICFADIDGGGDPEMVVCYRHQKWFPAIIRIYRPDRTVLGTYYHAGHLGDLQTVDVDDDGKYEVFATGTNNGHRGGAIVLLDDQHCTGASVDPGSLRDVEMQEGAAIRVVFPHFGPELAPYIEARTLAARDLRIFKSGGETAINVIVGEGDALVVVEMNGMLHPTAVKPTDTFLRWARGLPEEMQRLVTQEKLDEWLATCLRFGGDLPQP